MERVGTLINKLKEQFEQQADTDKLAVTAQMLLAELQANQSAQSSGSKVSVVLPSVSVHAAQPVTEPEQPVPEKPASNWLFEMPVEIPTLLHQAASPEPAVASEKQPIKKESFEFNTLLATHTESLNEKLKEERVEVAAALQGTPIRDLKKAIGINDRFLFVNDLFRGDENMYERSIKTINSFNIYPEAQYWIQRELKVKLSWPDHGEAVKIFDQLVKRRFS
ncbi:MAG: hypothetical protein EPO58_07175 [Chitinophagaceae bacterium]|nr:MAG: hypothetical protein EPO58_07175 [Chitinophagaceae bacterium]